MVVAETRSLGERLFRTGERIRETADRLGVSPIMTTVQDDIMEAWKTRGSDFVIQLLGITRWKLEDWRESRELETPPPRPDEYPDDPKYVRFVREVPKLRSGSCPRCVTGYVRVDEGEALCLNCGHRPATLEVG